MEVWLTGANRELLRVNKAPASAGKPLGLRNDPRYVADLSRQPELALSNLFLLVDEPNARLAVDSLAAHSQVAW